MLAITFVSNREHAQTKGDVGTEVKSKATGEWCVELR